MWGASNEYPQQYSSKELEKIIPEASPNTPT